MPSIPSSHPEVLLFLQVRLFFHVSLSPPFLPLPIPSFLTHNELYAPQSTLSQGDSSSSGGAQHLQSRCLTQGSSQSTAGFLGLRFMQPHVALCLASSLLLEFLMIF